MKSTNFLDLVTVLSLLLSLIFFFLAGLHLHWVFGGTWGFKHSLPTKPDGTRVLNPKMIDTLVVALGLAAFGLVYLAIADILPFALPAWMVTYGSWGIPSIFLLRAVGDFKYVVFFKSVKETAFGKKDTKIFSPLCLIIGLVGGLIKFL